MKSTSSDPNLLVGLDTPDDAAVYRVAPDLAIVQTVDYFTPIVDDAFSWGRIAAANALSDVYAMGARPVTALNLVGWPRSLDFALLGKVLDGASNACREAGVSVVGGHSIDDPEPKYGLAVTGTVHPDRIVRKTGAPPGSRLVLTKPLGMGIVSSGIKGDVTSAGTASEAVRVMSALNKEASAAMIETGVGAATDVTGFGLVGHLLQMLGTELAAELSWGAIPVLEEAIELAAKDVIPGGSRRNLQAMGSLVDAPALDDARRAVLFDAQTSGGLLIAVTEERAAGFLADLQARGVEGARDIGRVTEGDGRIKVAS